MASSGFGFVRFQNCFLVQNLPGFWVNPINLPCCFNSLLVNLNSIKSLGQKLKSVYTCVENFGWLLKFESFATHVFEG